MTNHHINKYLNYLIIAFAFTIVTTAAGTVLVESLILILFIIKLLFFRDFTDIHNKLHKNEALLTLFSLLAFSFISIIWSSDKIYAFIYFKKYYHFLLIPIIYISFNPKYIPHVFNSFLLAILLSQIMSYGIYLNLIEYNNVPNYDPSPLLKAQSYSLYLSYAAMIIISRFLAATENKIKILYALFFLTTVANLFINSARTGQVIFLVSIFLILFLYLKNGFKSIVIASVLSISIVTIAYNTSPIFKERGTRAYNDVTNALLYNNYSDSFGQRVSLWIMGANVFSENIFLGTGIGDEKNGMGKYADKYNFTLYKDLSNKGFIDYHNQYIQHAVQLGIIGLLLTILLFYHIFLLKFKTTYFKNLNLIFASSILIFSCVSNTLHAFASMTYFSFFLAILISISHFETNKTSL